MALVTAWFVISLKVGIFIWRFLNCNGSSKCIICNLCVANVLFVIFKFLFQSSLANTAIDPTRVELHLETTFRKVPANINMSNSLLQMFTLTKPWHVILKDARASSRTVNQKDPIAIGNTDIYPRINTKQNTVEEFQSKNIKRNLSFQKRQQNLLSWMTPHLQVRMSLRLKLLHFICLG